MVSLFPVSEIAWIIGLAPTGPINTGTPSCPCVVLFLRTSSLQSFVNLRRGVPGQLPPPNKDFEASLQPGEQRMIDDISRCSAVGSQETVRARIASFIEETGADELMLVSSVFEHKKRLRSYEILADAVMPAATWYLISSFWNRRLKNLQATSGLVEVTGWVGGILRRGLLD